MVCLVQGCGNALSPLRPDQAAWEGHEIEELIQSWGTPAITHPLGNDYVAYTWVESDGACERTFTAAEGRIVAYSEYGC